MATEKEQNAVLWRCKYFLKVGMGGGDAFSFERT